MKGKITRNVLIGMWGLTVCLLAIIFMISPNTTFAFLSKGITSALGFIGFWIIIPFVFFVGVTMILHKQLVKVKFGITLWGLLVIIIAFLILTSHWGSIGYEVDIKRTLDGFSIDTDGYPLYITFSNFATYFKEIATSANYSPYTGVMGGGFIGYFLLGILNSAFTPIGMLIVSWALFAGGLLMVLHRQLGKLFSKRNGAAKEEKHKVEKKHKEVKTEPINEEVFAEADTIEFDRPIEAPQNDDPITAEMMADLSMRNYNETHGLKKPMFSLGGMSSPSKEVFTQPQPIPQEQPQLTASSYSAVQPEPEEVKEESIAPAAEEVKPVEPVIPQPTLMTQPMIQSEVFEEEPVEEVPEEPVDKLHRLQPKAIARPPYVYPSIDLLDKHEAEGDDLKNNESCEARTELINNVFKNLGVGAQVVGYTVGPSVTRFDVQADASVPVAKIARIVDDISIRLGGVPTRFEPIVFGKTTSGLEIPNEIRTNVGLRESIEALPVGEKYICNIPFGRNISGELVHEDLKEFPHMLVCGTTGSGKSIFIHATIITLIMRNTPSQLKLVLIDPKKVEMGYYKKIPHLLCPNISEPKEAYVAMKKLVDEMERRYNLFAHHAVRDIKQFNAFAKEQGLEPLPVIVVFVDEYADLSEECKDIRTPVVRIAQKARAAGIHLVIATQRPSVNVIDGVIKANISTHVALMVASYVDSNTIIGEGGAEQLLGNGDMLVDCPRLSRKQKTRVQGCFVDSSEILRVTDFLREHYKEEYDPEFLDLKDHEAEEAEAVANQMAGMPEINVNGKEIAEEELYERVKLDITSREYCSISYIQRSYGVGFPKAGRLFNRLVKDGYVQNGGDARGSKVLIRQEQHQQMGSIEQSTLVPNEDYNPDESDVDNPEEF